MSESPQLTFLSLFVPDVKQAAERYQRVLGLAPVETAGAVPDPHPFAASAPVLFRVGPVQIALYEANPHRGTHPGDVGIGLLVDEPPEAVAERARSVQATVMYGPKRLPGDGRQLLVFMLPDRHFFEVTDR